ncbi:MAG: hypothetical protein HY762_00760 [Planctomycetes bacterium]|nr:hypothetical protein [Planctomycetota bacterium]
MYIPFAVGDTQSLDKFIFDVLALLVAINLGVTLRAVIKGNVKANRGKLALSWIFTTLIVLGIGYPLYMFRVGVRQDIAEINKKLGIIDSIHPFTKGFLYYRKYFGQKLKSGMKKDEINEIVREPSETIVTKDQRGTLIIYHYKIGKYGMTSGNDLFIYVWFDHDDIVKSVGYDNS